MSHEAKRQLTRCRELGLPEEVDTYLKQPIKSMCTRRFWPLYSDGAMPPANFAFFYGAGSEIPASIATGIAKSIEYSMQTIYLRRARPPNAKCKHVCALTFAAVPALIGASFAELLAEFFGLGVFFS